MRILVLAHGHPDLSPGGGERAAYSLFQRLKQSPDVTKVVFAAYADQRTIGHDASLGSFRGRSDEILVATPPVDGFTFQSLYHDEIRRLVRELIRAVKPDLVHIHHFIFWGIDVFELFKQEGVRVVMTLHEYAAICGHYGQMVKRDGRLCHVASPSECSLCLSSVGAGKMFVRNTVLKSFLSHVDQFIAPSTFLMGRYVAWGLPEERITVIENLLDSPLLEQSQARTSQDQGREVETTTDTKVTFGFFAQITPFKGLDILLEAVALLPEDIRRQVRVRVHGENRHFRDTDFDKRVQKFLEEARGSVSLMGGYRGEEVVDLMSACDWIVVPSIWWENSPVVMQEARLAARPLLVSNIGGMAEKIDTTVDCSFPARSPGALAEAISDIIRGKVRPDQGRLNELAAERREVDKEYFAKHCETYRRALAA